MEFQCEKYKLLDAVSMAHEIVRSKNVMSVLSNVLFQIEKDNLVIKATDLSVGFQTYFPVHVVEEGSITVPCEKVLALLRSFPPGEVLFKVVNSDKLEICPIEKELDFEDESKKSSARDIDFVLKTIPFESYPQLKETSLSPFLTISKSAFMKMIDHTLFSVSDDDTRYYINGIYMEEKESNIVMVSTDGRRLSYVESGANLHSSLTSGIIIPPRILKFLRKLLSEEGEISLIIENKTVFIFFDNYRVFSSLIDGNFPHYQRVIPETQKFLASVNRLDFIDAIRRVSIITEPSSKRIYVGFLNKKIRVRSEVNDLGTGKEEIECQYEGDFKEIALNYNYLVDPLKVIEEETVEILFNSSEEAVVVKGEKSTSHLHVIMPMKM